MEEKKRCPVCNKELDSSLVDVCCSAYEYIIDRIKKDHPDWVETDGACPKCVQQYKKI